VRSLNDLMPGAAPAGPALAGEGAFYPTRDSQLIAGVETVDHPSDAQLVAYARKYLKAADRMMP
jgi:hypothetical protein